MPTNVRGLFHPNYGYLIFSGDSWTSEWSGVRYGAFQTTYMFQQVNLPMDEVIIDFL